MKAFKHLLALGTAALVLTACGGSDDDVVVQRSFTVTVENVSKPGTLATDRAMGAVPISPGVYAVFRGNDPVFTVGGRADSGTELIAEDGFPSPDLSPPGTTGTKLTLLKATAGIRDLGTFASPGGTPDKPGIFPGESASFNITASPGDKLQIEAMFVQSNDWFYGFRNGGLNLFDGGNPVNGDVSAAVMVYDAGTEADTAPGTGPNQKPVQGPMVTNQGPADPNPIIRPASETGFTVPPISSLIRVTIMPR